MLTERPEHILPRMISDRWRVEQGERNLTAALADGTMSPPVAALLLDVDGSGPVRALGIGPKIRLVEQVRLVVRSLVPDAAMTVDSGTRDEVYVVLPDDPGGRRTAALGERIRAAVAQRTFEVADGHRARVTVSVGVAAVDAPRDGAEVFERARDALRAAKAVRNHVHRAEAAQTTVFPAAVPVGALHELRRRGADPALVIGHGLGALQEKHGPVWYWVAEEGGADRGVMPSIPYVLDDPAVPPGAVTFFDHLVAAVSFEAALTRLRADGTGADVTVVRQPDQPVGYDLAARYGPGEWMTARRNGSGRSHTGNVFTVVQAARDGTAGTADIRLPLGANGAAIVTAVAERRGRTVPHLLGEALQLTVDSLRSWDAP